MRELQNIMADRELSRAITALYLEVDESIVNDIRSKIDAALRAAKVEELERVQSRFRKDGIALTLIYLQYRIAELGRSAQIEEGE